MKALELGKQPLTTVLEQHPMVADFVTALGFSAPDEHISLSQWLAELPDEALFDAGMERGQILDHLQRLVAEVQLMADRHAERIDSVTLIGGRDKSGRAENLELTFRAGEIVCIVGPTGSGKSRLLGDIECLAQGDTPTGRRVLINGTEPDDDRRYAPDRKLVAQLSQNMNFVVDLSVRELIAMHAHCRLVSAPEQMADTVIACANALTGEKFSADVSVTQLSGGQTRALMIADAALLSASPVVLIDEIENAGVDRRQALELLTRGEKIVLISTHDPLLALRGSRRLVIRNGGIAEVIETSERERQNLRHIERIDATLMDIRERLRGGQRIEEDIAWPN
ncbi:ATP-binding cassette domain-containing protein [Azomonas macrocytogenes]|uniref:ABC-type lipoprotein export system ATPase subunit n=1 Tax=Azomonas macrocytogenes TaxID=69962 RepID=A0A839T5G4_AZOMA|nr:ABC transporter ATP-binding protein [Azomonas macrocytogenes]MBB3103175.1 ABC-type lipoprotein export system ATPase subunit [Azomonas macrocytogenes]